MRISRPFFGCLMLLAFLAGCTSSSEPPEQVKPDRPSGELGEPKTAERPTTVVIPSDFALETAEKVETGLFRDLAIQDVSVAIVRTGNISAGLEVAKKIEDAPLRIPVAVAAAQMAAQNAGFEQSRDAILQLIGDGPSRTSAIEQLSDALLEIGEVGDARKLADQMEDPSKRTRVLTEVASAQVRKGEAERATELLQKLLADGNLKSGTIERDAVLENLASALAKTGSLDRATEVSREIQNNHRRISALNQIATVLFAKAEKERAAAIMDEALEAAKQIEDPFFQAEALAMISAAMADSGKLDDVLAAIQALPDVTAPPLKPWACAETALKLVNANNEEQARTVAELALKMSRQAMYAGERSLSIKIVALAYAKMGQIDQSVEALAEIEEPHEQGAAVIEIALILKKRPAGSPALSHFSQNLKIPYNVSGLSEKASLWNDFARAHTIAGNRVQAGDVLRKARELTRLVVKPLVKSNLITKLAVTASAAGDEILANSLWRESVAAAREIKDKEEKIDALKSLALSLATQPIITDQPLYVPPMKAAFSAEESQLASQIAEIP